MAPIYHICHNATTFAKSGEVDEDAYRRSVQRLVDARIGAYAAGGSGECYALTRDEIGRLYDIAVDTCNSQNFSSVNVERNISNFRMPRIIIHTEIPDL